MQSINDARRLSLQRLQPSTYSCKSARNPLPPPPSPLPPQGRFRDAVEKAPLSVARRVMHSSHTSSSSSFSPLSPLCAPLAAPALHSPRLNHSLRPFAACPPPPVPFCCRLPLTAPGHPGFSRCPVNSPEAVESVRRAWTPGALPTAAVRHQYSGNTGVLCCAAACTAAAVGRAIPPPIRRPFWFEFSSSHALQHQPDPAPPPHTQAHTAAAGAVWVALPCFDPVCTTHTHTQRRHGWSSWQLCWHVMARRRGRRHCGSR